MQKVLFTENRILLSTSSGSGLMEGAIRSCTAKRAAVFSIGAFGDKWFKMAETNGIPADKFSSTMGEPTTPEMVDQALATGKYDLITVTHNETSSGIQNPVEEIAEVMKKYPDVVWCVDAVSSAAGSKIETDKLGIDVLITSTQKALALPPGLAICAMSRKAYDRTAEVKNRGLYFDLRTIWDFIDKDFRVSGEGNSEVIFEWKSFYCGYRSVLQYSAGEKSDGCVVSLYGFQCGVWNESDF